MLSVNIDYVYSDRSININSYLSVKRGDKNGCFTGMSGDTSVRMVSLSYG
jgi:hypothetical protein